MTTTETITVAAILLGPILAVQIQRILESLRDRRQRRLSVFHTLMATRAARVSHPHVQALNMIDIEFYGRRIFGTQFQSPSQKAVTNAWRIYSDHLNTSVSDDQIRWWNDEGDKLFAKLLHEMSRALGYDFDEVQLRRNVYSPRAHGRLEQEEAAIRSGLARVLSGQQQLPVALVGLADPAQSAPAVQPPLTPPPLMGPPDESGPSAA